MRVRIVSHENAMGEAVYYTVQVRKSFLWFSWWSTAQDVCWAGSYRMTFANYHAAEKHAKTLKETHEFKHFKKEV